LCGLAWFPDSCHELAGLAVALGPIVGGAVTQGIDWHWIFWINVPIGAVALPLAMRLLPDSYGAQERLDPLGVTFLTGGIVAIVWALVRANRSGWASAEIVSCLAGGAVLLLAFAAWEQRVSEPMVPLRLFRSRAFAVGNAMTFLMTGAIFAAGFLVTQEFQLARGYSPVSAGVRLLPFFATPMLISPIAGAASDRIGRRPVMATGLFLLAAGLAWAAIRGSLSTNWAELDIALLIAGVGVSMALPTVPTAVLNAVDTGFLTQASSADIASALGAATAGPPAPPGRSWEQAPVGAGTRPRSELGAGPGRSWDQASLRAGTRPRSGPRAGSAPSR
jgi:MFS family permease